MKYGYEYRASKGNLRGNSPNPSTGVAKEEQGSTHFKVPKKRFWTSFRASSNQRCKDYIKDLNNGFLLKKICQKLPEFFVEKLR
uniref:Uncharacterized protein n=1 Tax=Romanomermis culicivorax TaxID=13658 RepID=A0A915LB27_ROMCU